MHSIPCLFYVFSTCQETSSKGSLPILLSCYDPMRAVWIIVGVVDTLESDHKYIFCF